MDFYINMAVALVIGVFLAFVYSFKTRHTRSFVFTLAMLPAIVSVVIMLVNGNIGAGVAVAGAFSLVRFRSIPGTAEEIGAIFLAMSAGLACGMGCLVYAGVFAALMGAIMFVYKLVTANKKGYSDDRMLNITVPEDLNYTDAFKDLLEKYTKEASLIEVKTTNMGSLFRLKYNIKMKDSSLEKEMIDEMRCRNGNLEISIMLPGANELML